MIYTSPDAEAKPAAPKLPAAGGQPPPEPTFLVGQSRRSLWAPSRRSAMAERPKLRDAQAHLDQRVCKRGLKSDGPEYCNGVLVLGWTVGEVEQCLQELNDGSSYRTTPLTVVPFDLALRWGLFVVRLLDENEDIFVPPRFCGRSRTQRRRERRRASKAKSKAIESMNCYSFTSCYYTNNSFPRQRMTTVCIVYGHARNNTFYFHTLSKLVLFKRR